MANLQTARGTMDVNNPQAVARFREVLERRDAAYKRSTGLVTGDVGAANQRYNTRVGEYNSRARLVHGLSRRDVGQRSGDHFIAWSNLQRPQCERQGVRTRIDADAESGAD